MTLPGLARRVQLDVPLEPAQVLTRLGAALRGADAPMLDGRLSQLPAGREWAGRVEGDTFVLRVAAHGPDVFRNLHAVARGRVEAGPGGGTRLHLTFRPAWLDSPPLVPMVLLGLGGVVIAVVDRSPSVLGLVLALACVPWVLGALTRPLMRGDEQQLMDGLRRLGGG